MSKKIDLLVVLESPKYLRDFLAERYQVHYWPDAAHTQMRRMSDPLLAKIRAVQTNGSYGLNRGYIEAMPNLEIICSIGAGFEGVDVKAARERGIIVTHSPGANANSVADQGWAVLLGVMRDVPACDRGVRAGCWNEVRYERAAVTGKKLGIFGLGNVGKAMAKRGSLGFEMPVGYSSRRRYEDSGYQYFENLGDLAEWSDILVISAPSNSETYHIVSREVLERLGPDGYLINISRGALLDNIVLIEALSNNTIAGAGLDVVEGEPEVPEALRALPNVCFSPHIGGMSPDANMKMIRMVRDNLDAHFAGMPVLTPVP